MRTEYIQNSVIIMNLHTIMNVYRCLFQELRKKMKYTRLFIFLEIMGTFRVPIYKFCLYCKSTNYYYESIIAHCNIPNSNMLFIDLAIIL